MTTVTSTNTSTSTAAVSVTTTEMQSLELNYITKMYNPANHTQTLIRTPPDYGCTVAEFWFHAKVGQEVYISFNSTKPINFYVYDEKNAIVWSRDRSCDPPQGGPKAVSFIHRKFDVSTYSYYGLIPAEGNYYFKFSRNNNEDNTYATFTATTPIVGTITNTVLLDVVWTALWTSTYVQESTSQPASGVRMDLPVILLVLASIIAGSACLAYYLTRRRK